MEPLDQDQFRDFDKNNFSRDQKMYMPPEESIEMKMQRLQFENRDLEPKQKYITSYPVTNSMDNVSRNIDNSQSNVKIYERDPINKSFSGYYKSREPFISKNMIPKNIPNNQNVNNNINVDQFLKDPKLKKIVDRLEKNILKRMMTKQVIDGQLDSQLQKNIKEELKHRIMVDMRRDIKKKMAEYVATNLAAKIPKNSNIKNDMGSIYQDTVPPFYNPGIVLP